MAKSGPVRSFLLYGVGFLVLAGTGWEVYSIWQQRGDQLHATSQALAASEARGPVVRVMTVRQGPTERLITLLGDARPNTMATLYGKLGGYLAKINVDRGDKVKAGKETRSHEGASDIVLETGSCVLLPKCATKLWNALFLIDKKARSV